MGNIATDNGNLKAHSRDLTKEAALDLIGNPRFTWRLTRKQQNTVRAIAYKLDDTTAVDAFAVNAAREQMASNGRAVA